MPKKLDEWSNPAEPDQQITYDRAEGCLLRLFWTVAGNLALFALILSIINHNGFSLLDSGYWVVVVALAVSRYIEITRFAGQTLDGRPATVAHFRRYGIRLLIVATGLWILVHALQRIV